MNARLAALLGTVVLLFNLGTPPARSQVQQPAPRGFDYWQPDWMVRELWGPGAMPKGMMVRLLRHTTFMRDGVPKEYEGAKSEASTGPATIIERICAGVALPVRSALPATLASCLVGGFSGVVFLAIGSLLEAAFSPAQGIRSRSTPNSWVTWKKTDRK